MSETHLSAIKTCKKTIQSMTGFSSVLLSTRIGMIHLELRSVNSRFLDLQLRLCDEFRAQETRIREYLTRFFQRGKIECRLFWAQDEIQNQKPHINTQILSELAKLEGEIKMHFPLANNLSIRDILNWPGVTESKKLMANEPDEITQQALELATTSLIEARQREGQQLANLLTEKIGTMQQLLLALQPKLPDAMLAYSNKLSQRLTEAMQKAVETSGATVSINELQERIRQEVALHNIKIDVNEEIDRLNLHLKEFQSILNNGGAVGKRLDFLTQELNREANTLGAKSTIIEQTQASMDLKVLIEQVREQVQNIE